MQVDLAHYLSRVRGGVRVSFETLAPVGAEGVSSKWYCPQPVRVFLWTALPRICAVFSANLHFLTHSHKAGEHPLVCMQTADRSRRPKKPQTSVG